MFFLQGVKAVQPQIDIFSIEICQKYKQSYSNFEENKLLAENKTSLTSDRSSFTLSDFECECVVASCRVSNKSSTHPCGATNNMEKKHHTQLCFHCHNRLMWTDPKFVKVSTLGCVYTERKQTRKATSLPDGFLGILFFSSFRAAAKINEKIRFRAV